MKMIRELDEIKKALENIDVSTARGRRFLDKRELNIKPSKDDTSCHAYHRARGYLYVASELRKVVEDNPVGVPDTEIEAVELIMEQLEDLSRKTHEQVIRTY